MRAELLKIEREIQIIKTLILKERKGSLIIGGWISQKNLKLFFDYSDSQIKRMVKNENLKVARIGNRKFVSVSSVISLLDRKVQ